MEEEVKKELQNAAAKQVNHLRIATNAELKVEQVLRLQDLAKDAATSLLVWHRAQLTQRIEMQPFLRHFFFGDPQFPKLVPWDRYFSEYEQNLLPASETRIQSFEGYVNRAKEFLLSATSSVLLVSSPGGYGKSHLLRSIAQIAHEIDRRTQVWMMRGSLCTMQDAMQDEIVTGRRYLLIFDDADRFSEEIKPLLSFLRASNSIKVILALRTSGREIVLRNVTETRLNSSCEEIRISDWSRDDLVNLLRAAAKRERVEGESTIVAHYPNPFLIVWIGKQISGKSDLPLDNIKRHLMDNMDRETQVCLGAPAENLLLNLACVVPLNSESRSLAAFASVLKEERVADNINRLVQAGLLRVVGRNIRFNPDMMGDLYLAEKLGAAHGRLQTLLETWLRICPERLLINVAAATRFADVPSVEKSLSNILRSWVKGDISPFRSRKEVLDVIDRLVAVVPEQCMDVIDAFLRSPKELTTDDFGLGISELIRITTLRHRVLKAILTIRAMDIQGTYDNYRPQSLVRICTSPLHNSFQTIEATLDIINRWLDEPDHTHIELASAALCEVLAGAHAYTESEILTMTIGERSLRDTPEVRRLRQRAFGILEQMIDHASLEVKLAAITVAEEIGSTRMGSRDESTLPLSATIRDERRLATRRIGTLIRPDLQLMLMNKIDQLFLTWWARLTPGTEETEQYLQTIPRSAEYITFSYYVSSQCVVENFEELKNKAPTEGRWQWFVHIKMRSFIESEATFKDLVTTLNQGFASAQQVVQLLVRLNQAMPASERRTHPPIVTCWVKTNPPLFFAIRKDDRVWQRVPERFKDEIRVALAEVDDNAFLELAQEVLSELPDTRITKVELFLSSLVRHSIKQDIAFSRLGKALDKGESEKVALLELGMLRILNRGRIGFLRGPVTPVTVYEWLTALLTRGNSQIRSAALSYLCFIADKLESTYLLVRLVRLAVSREKDLSDAIVQSLHLLILNKGGSIKSLPSRTVDCLRQDLLGRLKHTARLDYRSEYLVEFAIQEIDPLMDFVESRILISLETNASEYQAIPFRGFQFLGQIVKSLDDYERLVTRIGSWYWRGPIWRYHLKVLMEELCEIVQVKPYAQKYVERQLEKGDVGAALVGCSFLPLDAETLNAFKKVGAYAISCGKTDEIESLLHEKTMSTRAFHSSPGEPSPDLVSRRTLFQQLRVNTNPGELNAIIDDCIERIDEIIEMELKLDEEILNPRA